MVLVRVAARRFGETLPTGMASACRVICNGLPFLNTLPLSIVLSLVLDDTPRIAHAHACMLTTCHEVHVGVGLHAAPLKGYSYTFADADRIARLDRT